MTSTRVRPTGPSLTAKQVEAVKIACTDAKDRREKCTPVRFLFRGHALRVCTGELTSRGTNVIYHPVYWGFPRSVSKRIARWLGPEVHPVFSTGDSTIEDRERMR